MTGIPNPPRADGTERTRYGAKHWALALVAFFLVIFAWSMAAPYDGTPDEREHIVRAAGVAEGQIAPPPAAAKKGTGAFQTVPGGLVRDQCWQFKPEVSAACAQPPGSDDTPTRTGTGAGRYFPAYYALVGGPLALWPGWPGVLLARGISALLGAALLAGAYVALRNRTRTGLLVGALVAAATPMAMHMASAVNPNGLEIAAGVAFFSAIIPLLLGRHGGSIRGLLLLAGLSGLLLAVLRQTGPLLVGTAFLAFAFPLRHSNLRALIRRPAVLAWAGGIILATLAALAWGVRQQTNYLGDYSRDSLTKGQALLIESDRWRGYLDQIVGVTSWLDTRMPYPPYLIWHLVAGALLVIGVLWGRVLDRVRLLVLLAGAVLIPSALQVAKVNETGFITQGRYMLPLMTGVLLYAAWVAEQRGIAPAQARSYTRLAVLALLPIQLFCLAFTMVRWQNGLPKNIGLSSLNPLKGDWHPVVGSATPLLAATLGLALFGWLAWTAARDTDAPADDTSAAAPTAYADRNGSGEPLGTPRLQPQPAAGGLRSTWTGDRAGERSG
ncbi:DUF2142 domain-containing protein [Micromonospora krabiensis]|uniref:Predicted membrane protein n=1 Tax=Micromonospora krabiensis TaxID=307121 RepID=A0A1C3N0L2_9ACTN|nr:DUF2142 domain-containing protein [Micromonospora krabiensis]SBV26095.1 Predicted membrane protein [Micromonospora krabiensis]